MSFYCATVAAGCRRICEIQCQACTNAQRQGGYANNVLEIKTAPQFAKEQDYRDPTLEPYLLAEGWGQRAIEAIKREDVWNAAYCGAMAAHYSYIIQRRAWWEWREDGKQD